MLEVIEGQRVFSLEEYHRMGEAGIFAPDERVELISGVIRRMSPKGRRHSIAVALANRLFVTRLQGRASVQVQDSVTLEAVHSEPEPDLVVSSNPNVRELRSHLSPPILAVEVSESSLRFDRSVKADLYAAAGISEYWIVNLVEDVLEVYRDPREGAYATKFVLGRGGRIAPLAFPDLEVAVTDLLP